jgi:hypothetical protein
MAAAMLCFVTATGAFAQAGPSERPPASFTGQQYVDSRGCVFLRAGYGGQVQWIQRISSARKPLCGYPPTFGGAVAVAEIAPEAPATPAVAAPAQPVVSQTVRVAPQVVQPAAQTVVRVAVQAPLVVAAAPQVRVAPQVQVAATGPGPGKIGCYKSAPVPMVVQLQRGGTSVVCTRGDGTMDGWRPPVYPQGAPVGAALNFPQVAGYVMSPGGQIVSGGTVAAASVTIPKGYKAAWDDDRLNLARGVGTAEGQAQQDQKWTREVPAQRVATQAPAKARITVSTNTNATAATGRLYVQVGTFGVATNAVGAAARLSSIGLPTAKSSITKNGAALQIVYAGPFGSQSDANAALSAARSAGFPDAFIR